MSTVKAAWKELVEDGNDDMPDMDLTFGNCPWLHDHDDDESIREDDPSAQQQQMGGRMRLF
jgi:hypothetical protein